MDKSEHDTGFDAGWAQAAREALWHCKAHIDRLEPGKQQRIRAAIEDLEASMRANLLSRRGISLRSPAPVSEERIHELATNAGFGFFGRWMLYQGNRTELVAFVREIEAAHARVSADGGGANAKAL